jgi:hypothetical protein
MSTQRNECDILKDIYAHMRQPGFLDLPKADQSLWCEVCSFLEQRLSCVIRGAEEKPKTVLGLKILIESGLDRPEDYES